MKELINYTRSPFIKLIDFKSRISRFEFFVGLAASGLFFALNAFIFIKFNSYANYLRDMDLSVISYLYILFVMVFTFIQCHSLVSRRLNDVSVNPYFAFIPFLLASSYLLIKSFYDLYEYGHLIFIVILLVIVITITLLVSETD